MLQKVVGQRLHATRRDILASAGAMGVGAALERNFASAEAAQTRINVHHHFFPPAFLEARRSACGR